MDGRHVNLELEARGGLRSGREFDSLLAPRGCADRHALLVQAASGVLHEAHSRGLGPEKPRIAASSQTSVATPKTTISAGPSHSRRRSVFGFVKTSKVFFGSRNSRPARYRSGRGSSGIRTGSTWLVSGIFRAPFVPRRQCGWIRRPIVGRVRDLVVGELVVVHLGHVDDARRPCSVDQELHRGNRLLGAGHVELPVRIHEVDLCVDVPENFHVTSSSRVFGLYLRPTLALGRPSVRTRSAVKSFEPRMSDEPTP